MTTPREYPQATAQKRRVRHQGETRNCRIAISVDGAEHRELEEAAKAEGLTVSAFVADKALAAARQITSSVATGPLREALQDLLHATTQLQRAGTNFNQCVAALNATGQPPENLIQYARYTAKVIRRIDESVTSVRQRLP